MYVDEENGTSWKKKGKEKCYTCAHIVKYFPINIKLKPIRENRSENIRLLLFMVQPGEKSTNNIMSFLNDLCILIFYCI